MATLLERVKAGLNVYRNGYPRTFAVEQKQAPFIWPEFSRGRAQWRLVNIEAYLEEGFSQNSLVYSAVMYKGRASASAPLRAYKGDPDNPEKLEPEHPLSKLVQRPNPSQSWREFQQAQTIYLNLTGDAFTYIDRKGSVAGVPSALYSMNPQRIFIVPEKGKKSVVGYVYVPENASNFEGIPIAPQDMMHVKLPNPLDSLDGLGYGLSPLSSAARSADVDNTITEFLQVFFERGAVNTGLITTDISLDDAMLARIRLRWNEIYGGFKRWGENNIGVLDSGSKYENIMLPFDQMGFETQDERNEARILGPFGVPGILIMSRLGVKASTLANFEQARQQFWEDTMRPELLLHEDEYSYYLQSDDGGFVAFDFSDVPAFQKDAPQLVTAWATLFDRGYTRNAAAEAVGLTVAEMPDGDVQYMPMTLMPIGQSAPVAPTTSEEIENAEEDTRAQAAMQLAFELKRANDLLEMTAKNGHKPKVKNAVS